MLAWVTTITTPNKTMVNVVEYRIIIPMYKKQKEELLLENGTIITPTSIKWVKSSLNPIVKNLK